MYFLFRDSRPNTAAYSTFCPGVVSNPEGDRFNSPYSQTSEHSLAAKNTIHHHGAAKTVYPKILIPKPEDFSRLKQTEKLRESLEDPVCFAQGAFTLRLVGYFLCVWVQALQLSHGYLRVKECWEFQPAAIGRSSCWTSNIRARHSVQSVE